VAEASCSTNPKAWILKVDDKMVTQGDALLREKLMSLSQATAMAQQRVNDHLIALLVPERMIVLWKLKGGLAQLEKMLKTTLQRPSLAVSEAILDMVQSTEAVLNEVDQRLRLFDEEDLA
jgi:hypothetical protein